MAIPRAATTVGDAALQYAKGLSSWFRDYLTAIKHGRIHPFTALERGPTGCQLNELTTASLESSDCSVIYAVLVFRMQYPPEKWRNVYKALQVLEFILKRGGEDGISVAKMEFPEYLESLSRFVYVGPDGRDYGVNVRVRATAVLKILQNDELLRVERQKLKRFSQKLQGYTREEMEGQANNEDDVTRSSSWTGREVTTRDPSETGPPALVGRYNRGAGEMKGVSLEENKRNIAELKRILARPENKICADCREQMPTWASINCGVFMCLKCSGIHRGLGVHVSKVRSCTLDTWLPQQVQFLSRTGNAVANAYWEATLSPEQRPVGDIQLAEFISDKYAHKRFASGTWPPESSSPTPKVIPSATAPPQSDLTLTATHRTPLEIKHVTNDLLKFEDEAFAFESVEESGQVVVPQKEATALEILAEEAAEQPRHKPTLSFENSALFEQRSSFLRMQSRLHSMASNASSISIQEALPVASSTTASPGVLRKSSEDVIKTTLLDLDALETISMTSQKNFAAASVDAAQANRSRAPSARNSISETPRSGARANGTNMGQTRITAHQNLLQRNSAPIPSTPVLNLLDAPLAPLPTAGTATIDRADPFAFMTALEPLTILHDNVPTEMKPDPQPQSSYISPHVSGASPSFPAPMVAAIPSTVPERNQEAVIRQATDFSSLPQRQSSQRVIQKQNGENACVVTPARGRSSKNLLHAQLSKQKGGGVPMNEMTRTQSQVMEDEEELKNVHELSRLDQLFVQQIEDFLHFGYRPSMYQKPSYL